MITRTNRSRLVRLLAALAVAVAAMPVAAFTIFQNAGLVLGQTSFSARVEETTADGLTGPLSVALDPTSGKLFVSDNGNNRVLRYASPSALSSGAAAEAVLGQPDFDSNMPATTQSGMDVPFGIAIDNAGRLWVADTNNSRVLRFDAAASKANGAAAEAVLGQPDFMSAAPGTTQSAMDGPIGVAVDGAGRLFVSDTNNSRVLRFDNAAALSNGAAASGLLGQLDYSSSAGGTAAQSLNTPFGVSIDAAGRLWVADFGNSRVLRFDAPASKANGAAAEAVLGQADFTSNLADATQSNLSSPYGVAADSAGRLWVADSYNNRLLRFDNAAALANGASASAVLGQPDFSSADPSIGERQLNWPSSMAVDPGGALWLADASNNRVLRFDDTGAAPSQRSRQYIPGVGR